MLGCYDKGNKKDREFVCHVLFKNCKVVFSGLTGHFWKVGKLYLQWSWVYGLYWVLFDFHLRNQEVFLQYGKLWHTPHPNFFLMGRKPHIFLVRLWPSLYFMCLLEKAQSVSGKLLVVENNLCWKCK